MKQTVSSIPLHNLCCSCGACSAVCSKGAISFTFKQGLFIPEINNQVCVGCGRCLSVCPSAQMDIRTLYGEPDLFSRDEKECYIAFSNIDFYHHIGTSGGVVSTMIYELLKNSIYEKAYVLDFERFDGKQATVRPIVHTDDIIRSAKSKYIPASIEEVIKDVVSDRIDKSIVVATPCQLLAIKKSFNLYKRSENNVLFIGLFCDKTLNYNIYEYYHKRFGTYESLHFRDKDGNGWPGDTVLTHNGESRVVDKHVRISLKPYFQLNRCRFCFDKLNQLADISCGDCYIDGEQTKEGASSVILRTYKGLQAFDACRSRLSFKKSSLKAIKLSQHLELKIKNYMRNRSLDSPFVFPNSDGDYSATLNDSSELTKLHMGAVARSVRDYRLIDNSIAKENSRPANNKVLKYFKRILKLFYNPDHALTILIDNAGFVNKGAELMLQSVVQQFERVSPNVRIVVPKQVFYENLNYCYFHRILPLELDYGRVKSIVKRFIFYNILNKPWYITPDKIDVVLDAGGFQFSDQWNPSERTIIEKKKYYSAFTKHNRKIIFLPQAFGPFEQPLARRLIQEVYKESDLIYARESLSYKFLQDVFPDGKKIHLAPDFTCLCLFSGKRKIALPDNYVVLVPNSRMITHTQEDVSSHYRSFLFELSEFLLKRGETLVFLNHEGNDDLGLLLELNERLSNKVLILSDLDALEVKRIIGGAKLLISSRYHGVVSGLIQGIPTLCTSWSHKYSELLKEHHCSGNVLSVDDVSKAKQLIVEALEHPDQFVSKEGCIDVVKSKVKIMWEEVFNMIGLI